MTEDAPAVQFEIEFLADVGRLSSLGTTVHLELGTTTFDGRSIPRAHIMMSHEFARALADKLRRALEACDRSLAEPDALATSRTSDLST